MKQIVVATDFSTAATNAACYAADMAVVAKAGLILLHVYQLPLIASEIPVTIDIDVEIEVAEKNLDNLKKDLQIRTGGNVPIQTEVTESSFFTGLREYCEKICPYAVVMGSQGTSKTERFLLGGHTVYAMKHLCWPLITVPPEVSFSGVRNIGLACDLKNIPETIPADEITTLVRDFDAKLHILNTGTADDFDPEIVFASGELKRVIGGVEPCFHFISDKDVDRGILEFASRENIDLLIVLPRRHGILHNLLHRSHTKLFVLHSYVPVMALHTDTH